MSNKKKKRFESHKGFIRDSVICYGTGGLVGKKISNRKKAKSMSEAINIMMGR